MAHHKRKGPKSTRAGCLLCKPHKRQGASKTLRRKFGDLKRMQALRPARLGLTAALQNEGLKL